jgi:hypothetical protein
MKAMAKHFWCDLLAAFSCAINDLKKQLDKVPDRVISTVLASAHRDRHFIDEVVVRLAVRTTWKAIRELPFFGQVDDMLRAMRILAVLMCKAPEDHRAVARCCIFPLTKGLISAETKRRLEEIFPKDWLLETRRSLSA